MDWLFGPYPAHGEMWGAGLATAMILANLPIIAAYLVIGAAWGFLLHSRSRLGSFVKTCGWFIFWCGLTHVAMVTTIFYGGWVYWLEVLVLAVCAAFSFGAFFQFLRLLDILVPILKLVELMENHSDRAPELILALERELVTPAPDSAIRHEGG